jgi:hypothetical protein
LIIAQVAPGSLAKIALMPNGELMNYFERVPEIDIWSRIIYAKFPNKPEYRISRNKNDKTIEILNRHYSNKLKDLCKIRSSILK